MKINFYLIKHKNKPDGVIYIYVRKNNETLTISTNIFMQGKYWDKKKQRVIFLHKNAHLINKKLDKIREEIEALILIETANNLNIPIVDLFWKVKAKFLQKESKLLIEVFDDYIEAIKSSRTLNYLKKVITVKNHIANFNNATKIADLNYTFVDNFVNYLLNNNASDVYIKKILEIMRSVLRFSFNRTIEPFDISFLNYKGNENDTTFSLTLDEIKLLLKAKTETKEESIDLDAFIFACFTGLRFSDVKNFSKKTIKDGFIELLQQKTKKKNRIVLLPQAKEILDKYNDDKPFKSIHSQLTNKRLKAIAKRTGLNREIIQTIFTGNKKEEFTNPLYNVISFHTARRTFATLLTSLNLNPDLIKAMTGHRTHKEFEKYIKFNEQQLKQLAETFSFN